MTMIERSAAFFERLSPEQKDERAFLPAALEIVETPPPPLPRIIGALVMAFFTIALLWSYYGYVDVIATAPGKIIPGGRAKVIQPLDIGSVKAIRVEDGQHVKAGDVLIELNPTSNEADKDRFSHDVTAAKLDVARLRGLLHGAGPDSVFTTERADASLVLTARRQMQAQRQEQQAKLDNIDRQLEQKRAEHDGVRATITKLEESLPLTAQRAKLRSDIAKQEFGSKLAVIDSQQQLVEQQNELLVQRHHLDETSAGIKALLRGRQQVIAEFNKTVLSDLSKAELQAQGMGQELRKATDKTNLQRLTAPVDGVVQQLAVHTIGGVVTPAEQLMVIVPSGAKLEVEATIENKDIGFIDVGQLAEIKIETFSFTRYGLVHGRVSRVSRDAVPLDKPSTPQPGSTQPSMASSQNQSPQSLGYIARVALDRPDIQIGNKRVALEPGMAVTVEIKTDRRRVIDYILSPIQKYTHDSLRER